MSSPIASESSSDSHHSVLFTPSTGLSEEEALTLLTKWGRNELEEKRVPAWFVFLQQLWQPMPIMIWIAALVEAGIQNWPDMGILLGIQLLNASVGFYETQKAGDAVAALKASLKPNATVKRGGTWRTIDASLLVPGDLVLLGSGSAVPADCLINHGQIDVDQSALTGESLPVTFYPGDQAKMGSVVVRGETEATVEHTGSFTFFGTTAKLLQSTGSELGHFQKILIKIMLVLVVTSLILCFSAFGYLLAMGESFTEALQFTVILLVVSIPMAIELVCTTTLALGSRQLAAHGAIVKRLAAIEDMAGMNMLCSDKTGTLTLNKMAIQHDTPVYVSGLDQHSLLRLAAMASKWKEPARDALDSLVLGAVHLPSLSDVVQHSYTPFDPTRKRTEGVVTEEGFTFRITKGAPNVIITLSSSDHRVASEAHVTVNDLSSRGIRCLAVARGIWRELVAGPYDASKESDDPGWSSWQLLGLLTFLDPPRPDTKRTIERAFEYGVDVKMITGDHRLIAIEMARLLGLGLNIEDASELPSLDADGKPPKDLESKYGEGIMKADGFSQVFPEHKYLIVECLRRCGFAVGMTGDGVNDAPALKRADCGVAVEGSTDAARAAADIVLTQPGLSTIVEAIIIARQIFQRMKTFITYRIAATLQILVFLFIAVLALHPSDYQHDWPTTFKMPVLLLMLITLLNDGTLISIGYDSVKPSQYPEKWNLPALFASSIVLGIVACGSSLLLLWAALDSHNPNGVFAGLQIPPIEYAKITTLIYLKVSITDFLTLFSARTLEGFFFSSTPSVILLTAAVFSLSLSTVLASAWPSGILDSVQIQGLALSSENNTHNYTLLPLWTWIYCIFFWFVQDICKVVSNKVMRRYNLFHINTSRTVNMRESDSANDLRHPLATTSVKLVPMKLLINRTQNAIDAIDKMSSEPYSDPQAKHSLQRLSLTLNRMKRDQEGRGQRRASDGEITPMYQAGKLRTFPTYRCHDLSTSSNAATRLQFEQASAAKEMADRISGAGDKNEIEAVVDPVLDAAEKMMAVLRARGNR